MRELIRQRPAIVIFVAALAVRLVYLAFWSQPPVQFDARQYVSVAAAAPLAVTHPSLWNDTTARDDISLSRLMNDFIADEQISWFPYEPPSFGQALDWLFFSGPTYPAFLSTVFHITPFQDFWIVRVLQAMLDSLTAVLIWMVMRRLISLRGAWVAAGFWVVYGPAIIKTGELLTETLSVLLTVLMIWFFLRAYDTQRGRWLMAAGAICSLLAMTKASTTLLIVPLIVAWFWANRKGTLGAVRSLVLLAGTWLVVMSPWLLLVNHRLGQITVRDPSYGDANFRQANILETEGYNTDKAPTDFWTYPVWRELRNHPSSYARLYVQKFRRLWWRACDDYRIGFPFGDSGVQWFHRLLVLFAAVGFCVWTRRAGPPVWMAIAIVTYFAGLHTVMHVVSRYNLLAMPFVIGAAVCGVLWVAEEDRHGFVKRLAIILTIVAAAIVLIHVVVPSFWLMVPGVGMSTAVWLYWISAVTIILGAVAACLFLRRASERGRVEIGLIVGGVIAIVFLGWATTREAYAEWSIDLSGPGVRLERVITLPPETTSREIVVANVLIDGFTSRDAEFTAALDVDFVHSTFPESLLVVPESFYGKGNYFPFMRMNGDRLSNIRCWSKNVIGRPLLDSIMADGVVNLSVSIESTSGNRGTLTIFGDLPQESSGVFAGPGQSATSIERYYEGTDPRLWDRIELAPTNSQSRYSSPGQVGHDDLSTCLGRQSGQYRLLLRLLLADGSSLYY